jgi:hypothetical protein
MGSFEIVLVTAASPVSGRPIAAAPAVCLALLDKTDCRGRVCPLLVLERPFTAYWTLNMGENDG